MSSNKVIIFSAPSGSGKTTLVKYCLKEFPQLKFSVSATTRKPRGEEKHGKDYFFFSVEDFKNKIKNHEFIEYEEVYPDKFYGTLKAEVDKIWANRQVVIFDVDVVGGKNLKSIFKNQALSIFIAPPSIEELENRLIKRKTEDEKSIQMRVEKAEKELEYAKFFDKVIVNDDLEVAQKELHQLISEFLNQ